jgi:hypothetical protein
MNANLPKPETLPNAPTEERLAKLTGFNNPSPLSADSSEPSTSSVTASPLLSDEDVEEQITRHSFASSPLSKLVFVAGAVFFVVFVASLFLSQFQSPGESVLATKPDQTKESERSPLLSPDNQDKEKGELLSELALREQQERLRDLESQKVQKPQLTALKPPENLRTGTAPVPPSSVRQVVRQPPPRPQSLPVRSRQPIRPPSVVALPQATATDPTQLWTELAQVGSFGGGIVTNSPSSNSERLTPKYEPKTASSNVVEPDEPPVPEPNPSSGNGYKAIPFGQSVSAVLATTIAWEGSRGSRTEQTPDDRYIVTLNEPFKDKFGNLEIPSGSQIIIRLEGGSNALVTLTAESIIVNGVESKLPQGALKIRGADAQPLIAQMTTIGGKDGNDNAQALTDILSIAGDFADIPGTRSISSLYRTVTGGGNRRSSSGITAIVFFLSEDTPLEVFVNRTFSLDVPEKPLELDLGAIELPESNIALKSANTVEED